MTVSDEVKNWLAKFKQATIEIEEESRIPKPIDQKKLDREARKQAKNEQSIIDEKAGFIYILKSENGFYKIGKAKDLQSRVTAWKHEFPIKIDLIHSFACKDRTLVENFLHNKYSKKRLQREWYKLNDEDISWILNLKDYELG